MAPAPGRQHLLGVREAPVLGDQRRQCGLAILALQFVHVHVQHIPPARRAGGHPDHCIGPFSPPAPDDFGVRAGIVESVGRVRLFALRDTGEYGHSFSGVGQRSRQHGR
jgi:hypothetical protein